MAGSEGAFEVARVMSRQSCSPLLGAALFAGLASLLFAAPAQAGMSLSAATVGSFWRLSQPIESVQYYALGDNDYCWYPDGWQGPGWYQCGDDWNDGLGWGGPYGWNGWGGGRFRPHGRHRVGVWHPGPPSVLAGAPSHSIQSAQRAPAKPNDRRGSPSYVHPPAVRNPLGGAAPAGQNRNPGGHQDSPSYVHIPSLRSLSDGAALAPLNRSLGGHERLPQPAGVPALGALSGGAAVGRVGPGLEIEQAPSGVYDASPDYGAISGLPHYAAPGLHGLGDAGVHAFHPSGGFRDSGFHAEAGLGRFSGFHPGFSGFHSGGGGMFIGGHAGGGGHR